MKNHYSFNILNKLNAGTYFLAFTILFTFYGYSQNSCDVDFEIVKNRNSKKAGKSGTHYKFWITNKSNQPASYILNVENSASDETKMRGSKRFQKQVNLPSKIKLDEKTSNNKHLKLRKSISNVLEVSLKSNEKKLLKIEIDVPKGIAIGSRNTSKVTLKSSECKSLELVKYVYTEIVEGE